MAYLMLATSEENTSCFKFIGTTSSTKSSGVSLISNNTSLISNNTSLISSDDCGFDTCSFYDGPSESTIMAYGESFDNAGSIAYTGSESCGSIAYSGGGESCGSVASSVSSGSSFGGGCSYSC